MTKHRMKGTPEYNAWQHAKKRCNNPKDKEYHRYGAKGIRMCPQWENDFMAFFLELGPRPTPEHSLDRINGSKGYEPGNVRWATKEMQAQNRPEFVRALTYRSKTQTVAEWARELGLRATTIYERLNAGKSVEESLSTSMSPGGAPPRLLTHGNRTNSVRGWARELGLAPQTIRDRLKRGWSVALALSKA